MFASWRKQRRGNEKMWIIWGITKCKQIFPCVYHTLVSRNFVFWVFVKKEGCTIEKLLKNDWAALCIVNKLIWMNEVLFRGTMGSISLNKSYILWGLWGASYSLNNRTLILPFVIFKLGLITRTLLITSGLTLGKPRWQFHGREKTTTHCWC